MASIFSNLVPFEYKPRNHFSLNPFTEFMNIDYQTEDDWPLSRPRHILCPKHGFFDMPKMVNKQLIGKDDFKVKLNLHGFKPEHLKVKVVDNNKLTVEGNYEEESENGYIKRHIYDSCTLPENIILDGMKSKLTEDGILCIEAPVRRVDSIENKEKMIPISMEKSSTEVKKDKKDWIRNF